MVTGVARITAAALVVGGCGGGADLRVAEPVTVASGGASNPTVAVGADGAYYVAWVGTANGESNVWLARSADGRSFPLPVRVNDIAGDAAPHEQAPAQVAAGPHGIVYVAWQNNRRVADRRFPYSDLRLARSSDGGQSFEPAITVNDDAAGPPSSHTFHDIAVGDDGTVVVSWIDARERTRLEGAGAPAGMSTHGEAGLGNGPADPLPGPEIRIARSADSGRSFEPSQVVAAEACPCCRTSLDVAPDGTIAVSWRAVTEDNIRDVVVARGTAAGFGQPVRVHDDGWRIDGCPHAGAGLALDAAGRTHVAWYTGAAEGQGLFYAMSEGDATFDSPHPLLTGGWVPVSQVKLAATSDGVVLAWDDRRAEPPMIRIAAARDGSTPRTIARTLTGASPAVAAAGDRVAIAWLDGETIRFTTVTR
jgi:hypothetical protein